MNSGFDAFMYSSHSGYRFGSRCSLSSFQLSQLVRVFQSMDHTAGHVLGGRRSVSRVQLEGIGAVVVKHYRRGGVLAHLISRSYLKIGKTRSQMEYEQMEIVRKMGVRTPEPVAFACRGGLFYRAWLVTREVAPSVSMAQLSHTAPERTAEAMGSLLQQVDLLVAQRVRHADFHPGNVLIDERNLVYIIDFDKAGLYIGSQAMLRSAYKRRWCRAVRKHNLPPMLYDRMWAHIP